MMLVSSFKVCLAERELPQPRAGLDVVLLFDASGSMLKTDAQNLRYQGAKLLLSFLGEGDRLGVVQFAGKASVVQGLEPFSPNKAKGMSERIEGIKAEGQFTDITEGIKLAASLLEQNPRAQAQRVIVLLSDGKVEPDPSVGPAFARTLEMVHDVLPELKAKEVKVFTLCFSDGADKAFLGEVAAATDGLTWFTQSVEDVHKSFAELFLAVKRPQVVQQTGRGFSVDSDVTEATFYINHGPEEVVKLISPKGDTVSAEKHSEFVTWFSGKNFDVVTITDPDDGAWQVTGTEAHDGFATVMTDLKLLTDWPLTVRNGDEPLVQARLYDREKPVSLPEMSGVLKIGFQIVPTDKVSAAIAQEALNDDGVRGDKVARDGIFSSATMPMQIGSYKLVIVAKGPTFQRSQQIPFTVLPRLVSLEVRSESIEFDEVQGREGVAHPETAGEHHQVTTENQVASSAVSGDERAEILVTLSKEASGFKKVEVDLAALSAEREKIVIPMKRVGAGSREFVLKASDLPKDGEYRLKALLRAEIKKGELISAESPVVTFSLTSTAPRTHSPETHQPHEEKETPKEEVKPIALGLPIVPLGLVSACNAALLACAIFLLGKRSRRSKVVAQKYLPHKQLLDAIAGLEERAAATSMDFADPLLQFFEGEGASGGAVEGATESAAVSQSESQSLG
jgi:uncharacterized protein (TIGR03503 family)